MDAASIAAISALSHFRRPDVAIQGRDITVVSLKIAVCVWQGFYSVLVIHTIHFLTVQSRRERSYSTEHISHAYMCQLCVLPAGVRNITCTKSPTTTTFTDFILQVIRKSPALEFV